MAAKLKAAPMSAKVFSASTIVLFLICLMYGITYIDRNNVSTVFTPISTEVSQVAVITSGLTPIVF
jgi:hypothetical protein